jgi:hypothetical protein
MHKEQEQEQEREREQPMLWANRNLRYRFGSSSINTSVIQVRSIDCG